MKELLPTFTFGFLMAQLFPGATTVLCLTCPYLTYALTGSSAAQNTLPNLMSLLGRVGDLWFGSTRNAVVFLFLAAATGMFLHGLDWLVIGWETQECDDQDNPVCDTDGNPKFLGIEEMRFHKLPVGIQMLGAPLNMFREIFRLLKAPRLKWITVEENAPKINATSLPIFNWLQDFYLYFGQFYIHMAYALLIGWVSFVLTFLMMGSTRLRVLFLILIYFQTGLFYLMGRTQLASLFKNEGILVDSAKQAPSPTEIVVTIKD